MKLLIDLYYSDDIYDKIITTQYIPKKLPLNFYVSFILINSHENLLHLYKYFNLSLNYCVMKSSVLSGHMYQVSLPNTVTYSK